jgi:hypothetical protein
MMFGWAQVLAKDAAPVKVSLFEPVSTPKVSEVKGLDLGIITTVTNKVTGAQVSFIYCRVDQHSIGAQAAPVSITADFDGAKWGFVSISRNLRGYHAGFVTLTNNMIGYQTGFISRNVKITGVQTGFVNLSKNVSGLQLGLLNITEQMNGVQVGLVNIITQSNIPVMIVLNARFK